MVQASDFPSWVLPSSLFQERILRLTAKHCFYVFKTYTMWLVRNDWHITLVSSSSCPLSSSICRVKLFFSLESWLIRASFSSSLFKNSPGKRFHKNKWIMILLSDWHSCLLSFGIATRTPTQILFYICRRPAQSHTGKTRAMSLFQTQKGTLKEPIFSSEYELITDHVSCFI